MQATLLTRLDLSWNKLSTIDGNWGKCLVAIKELDLRHNEIERIEESSFDGMMHLRNLWLGHNKLDDSTGAQLGRLLEKTTGLEVLDLSVNRLTWAPSNVVGPGPAKSLRELLLTGNRLLNIKADMVNDMISLSTLDLSNNGLTDLGHEIFAGAPNLTCLNLSRNLLTTFPVGMACTGSLVGLI